MIRYGVVKRKTLWLLTAIATTYTAGLLGLIALWRWQPQRWWVALSNLFAPHLFWPLALLTPAALLNRSRWLRVMVGLQIALYAVLFGRQLLPRWRPTAKHGTALRVLTYNYKYLNHDAEAIIAAIRAQHADVVALQELTAPIAAELAKHLRDEYPHQALVPAVRQNGLGILSRHPFVEAETKWSYRGQRAVITIAGQHVTLLNVHPTTAKIERIMIGGKFPIITNYAPGERAKHFAALLHTVDAEQGPLVVLGDFNMGDREALYNELSKRLRDVYREAGRGFGFTFPINYKRGVFFLPFPVVRIDYIWVRGPLTATHARVVWANGGSDHCMLTADLILHTPSSA